MNAVKAITSFLKQWALLIAGILISGTVSAIIGGKIPWSTALFIWLTLSICLAVIAYISLAGHEIRAVADGAMVQEQAIASKALAQMQVLAESMETTVDYHEELDPDPKHQLTGSIYHYVAKLVGRAEKSVWVVVNMEDEGADSRTAELYERVAYLAEIERVVRARMSSGFTYVRVFQQSRYATAESAALHLEKSTLSYCLDILEFREDLVKAKREGRKAGDPSRLSIMFTDKCLMAISFMIVDERYLVVETDSIDRSGTRYAAGFLIIEDRGGRIVSDFLSGTRELMSFAHPIDVEACSVPRKLDRPIR